MMKETFTTPQASASPGEAQQVPLQANEPIAQRQSVSWDSTCPCHQDIAAIAQIARAHLDGLCTTLEAERIIAGKQF
ncbi:MAG TPA: hypothetical protein VFV38_29875 [Ktedonobacteraceae bacterium]|nr:hypothetical protein [Ktedonobacteraceae bacterium]